MNPKELAELKALYDAATPGEWYLSHQPCGVLMCHGVYSGSDSRITLEGIERIDASARTPNVNAQQGIANHAFIAAARTAIPKLIAQIKRQQECIAAIERVCKPHPGIATASIVMDIIAKYSAPKGSE